MAASRSIAAAALLVQIAVCQDLYEVLSLSTQFQTFATNAVVRHNER